MPSFSALTVRRLVLTGFMGAGKSTTGPILAERLGWRFIDADQHLQQRSGVTISELFSTHGEPAFRQMEADLFADLHTLENVVIALGGGAIEAPPVRSLIAGSPETCMVFLDAPLAVMIARCEAQPDAAIRPVFRNRAALGDRYHSRLEHYNRAHIRVLTDGCPPAAVADQILQQLQEKGYMPNPTPRAVNS